MTIRYAVAIVLMLIVLGDASSRDIISYGIHSSKESSNYKYIKDIDNGENVVILKVHFKNVFGGPDQDLAIIDQVWQVSDINFSRVIKNSSDRLVITSYTPLKLEEGYELAIKAIDIDGNKAYVELSKNRNVIDSKIIMPPQTTDEIYTYSIETGSNRDIELIRVHFEDVLRVSDQNLATIDQIWQVSDNNSSRVIKNSSDGLVITSGAPLKLEEGYELAIKSIDISGNKAYVELSKNGNVIDSKIIIFSLAVKGNALYDKGEIDEAIKVYEEAIRLNPNDAKVWNSLGDAFIDQDKIDEAIKAYEEAIKLEPDWATPWNNKGEALFDSGKYDEAIKAYEEAIRLDSNDSDIWHNKGIALEEQGKIDEAIVAYDEAIRLDASKPNPETPEALCKLGLEFEARGLLASAITCYNTAIKRNPDYDVAWNSKISALKKMGRYDEVDDAYYEYRYSNMANILDYISWLSCGFGIRWWNTILTGLFFLILFTIMYSLISAFGNWNKAGFLQILYESFWFSLIVLISAPKELYPLEITTYGKYARSIKYLPVLERILGWALLILLINALSRVMIRY